MCAFLRFMYRLYQEVLPWLYNNDLLQAKGENSNCPTNIVFDGSLKEVVENDDLQFIFVGGKVRVVRFRLQL